MKRLARWITDSIAGRRFPVGVAVFVYIVSYGQNLLLGNSYFWDDWQNRITKAEFARKARLSGFPPTREILEYDLLGNSGIFFRILTFVCYFVAAVCLHRVLHRGLSLSNIQVNVFALLFLVAPVNSARAAMIIMHYSFSLALFYCAWALLVSSRKMAQVVAIPLFWISFGTPSLLPFFLLPLAHWTKINCRELSRLKVRFLGLMFIATPVSYWMIRTLTFGSSVREYYVPRPLGVARGGLFVSLSIAVLAYGTLRRKWKLGNQDRPMLASLSFLAISLGASTYMAGGHLVDISDWLISFVPNYSDWDSRHQLLLGLGIAGLFTAAIANPTEVEISPHRLRSFLVVLGVFCILNFTFAQEYYLDSLKQDQVIESFKQIPELQTVQAIMIDDQAFRFNARGRGVRSFEWQEMIRVSLGRSEPIVAEPLTYVNCSEFTPTHIIQITATNGRLEALLTRNVGIQTSVIPIDPCQ